MEFSLKKPTLVANYHAEPKPTVVANLGTVDATGTSARAYLRTATKAKNAENFKREAELIEKAIATMGTATPNILRRYAASLYKCGEFRAAKAIIANPRCAEDGGEDYVKRMRSQLDGRFEVSFEKIIDLVR